VARGGHFAELARAQFMIPDKRPAPATDPSTPVTAK
jgi:hypothetical protein